MSSHLSELARVPALLNHWVAIEPPGGPSSPANDTRSRNVTPMLRLPTGATVIDADADLDELCARINADHKTSLTIVFNARR